MKSTTKKLNIKKTLKKKKVEKKKSKLCGAKTRAGGHCRNLASANGKCSKHGGNAGDPGGTQKGFKHGLYADVGLHEDEVAMYLMIELGVLDEEVKMTKIKLMRAHRAQKMWEEEKFKLEEEVEELEKLGPVGKKYLELSSWEEYSGEYVDKEGELKNVSKRKVVRTKHDFSNKIFKYTKLVAEMELKRKELVEKLGDKELIEKMVDHFRGFTDDAASTMPGGEV